MHDEGAVLGDDEGIGFPLVGGAKLLTFLSTFLGHRAPFFLVDVVYCFLHSFLEPFQRHVGPHNSHCASLLVVDGHQQRYQRCDGVVALEERLRPNTVVDLERIREPLCLQIVVIGTADVLAHEAVVSLSGNIRAEPMSFLRIVVGDEADAAIEDTRIHTDHSFHDVVQMVRSLQILLYLGNMVDGAHIDIGQ